MWTRVVALMFAPRSHDLFSLMATLPASDIAPAQPWGFARCPEPRHVVGAECVSVVVRVPSERDGGGARVEDFREDGESLGWQVPCISRRTALL